MKPSLRFTLVTLAVAALAGAGLQAQAATDAQATAHADAAARATRHSHARRMALRPQPAAERLDRMHLEVALARDAEQQRHIAQALRAGRMDPAQAEAIERRQARIDAEIARFRNHGPISVDDALALQHQQDVQDWAVHAAWSGGATRRS